MLERIKKILKIKSVNESTSVFEHIDHLFNLLNEDIVQIVVGSDITPYVDSVCNVIEELRNEIKDECGFIIPAVRTTESAVLQENEFHIKIHGVRTADKFVIPTKDNIKTEVYEALKSAIYENLNAIFTNEITERYINSVQKNNSLLIWNVTNVLSVIDIKIILTDIINKGKSINNINYVFERIGEEILESGDSIDCSRRYNPHYIAKQIIKTL